MTPREKEEFEQEFKIAQKQADYGLKVKQLELEIKKIEVKWQQVFRVPFAIISLPVRLIMAFAVPISAITKKELPESFWNYLKSL